MTEPASSERGILSIIGTLIGGGCLLVAVLGVVNTAFDLDLALGYYGTSTPLPDSYEVAAGLAAVGLLLIGLSFFGSFVRRKFDAAKGKPLARVGILVGALVFLVIVGRALQVAALLNTYGSMLAYYSTDGDLDDVKAELAKGPDREALDHAVSRAAQYDNAGALALLLEAGADMRQSTQPAEYRHCPLLGRSHAFVETAISHGIKADACPGGEAAIWDAVERGKDDEEAAKIVALLRGAGWSASAAPEYDERSPREIAAKKNWAKTLAAIDAAPR